MPRPNLTRVSNRYAAVLIALVTLQILLSAVIPQEEYGIGRIAGTGEFLESANPVIKTLQLDRIYYSVLFQVTLGLLALILIEGNVRRVRQVRNASSRSALFRHLGSMIFHFSLLLVVGGILLNAGYMFDGVLGLTEGQEVLDEPDSYTKIDTGYLVGDGHSYFRLRLEAIDREHPLGDTTTEAALLTLHPGSGAPHVKGVSLVNRPFRWQGLELHLGSLVGYSPEILVLNEGGRPTFKSFIRVRAVDLGNGSLHHQDFQKPFGDDRQLRVTVHEPRPDRGATVELAVLDGEEVLDSGVADLGDTLNLAGERVAVPRMRRWCYLFVVRNPWLWLVFTGFWLALAGQAISVVARTVSSGGSKT